MKQTDKKRILVVEDDPHIAEGLKLNLNLQGYETAIANSGTEGLRIWKEWNPNLVVLDIMMPHLNGYDVCRTIKQDPVLKSIPIILLTSRGKEVDPRLLELMGIEYLHKTARPQELLAMLEKTLGH